MHCLTVSINVFRSCITLKPTLEDTTWAVQFDVFDYDNTLCHV